MKDRFVVVDLETTGNSPKSGDRIIQIGAVVIEDKKIVHRFSHFVNPGISVPPFIEQLTGITDEMIKDAPSFDEIIPEFLSLLNNSYFVAHNVQFDLSFIDSELQSYGYSQFSGHSIDTVELARLLLPTKDSYKLGHLANHLDVVHERPHQADSDAEVTGELLIKLFEKIEGLPLITLQRLQPIVKYLNSDLDDVFTSIIQKKLKVVNDDEVKYDIYRQIALKKRNNEANKESKDTEDFLSFQDYQDQFNDDNVNFAKVMPSYEKREGQQKMMSIVSDSLDLNQHLLIEAGTGTGKSLAYLLPSVFFAKNNREKVVISTHTIQLQEQLVERDLPILKETIPFSFRSSVLKGRGHYLCLRKFEHHLSTLSDDHYDALLTKGQILVWLLETDSGDVEELNLPSGGRNLWDELKSDPTSCMGPACPWFSRCFYHNAKRLAHEADLIITNHALLFTDLIVDHQLLPSYKYVIIDEAHHIEDVASDHFGSQSNYFSFVHSFNRLGTFHQNELLANIAKLIHEHLPSKELTFSKIDEGIQNLRFELDELFRMIHTHVLSHRSTGNSEVGRISYRYQSNQENGNLWSAILEGTLRISSGLKDIIKQLKLISGEIDQIEEKITFIQKGFHTSLNSVIATLEEERSNLEKLILEYDPHYVYWLEVDAKGAKNAVYLYSKPIDISDQLADHFFANKKSVVMTSATLTIKNSFDYIIDRLGLADFGPLTQVIESPFNFEEQVQMMIPSDIPKINDISTEEYAAIISNHLFKISEVTNGRMMVLFTSYDMLRKTYLQFKDLNEDKFVLIGQGINSSSRAKLTKSFKQFDQAILFGTSSFWEGVDIPGEDLSCLVIVRLPFSPPDNPVMEAKAELLKEQGKNPFMELSLPQAVIRFKQGFGRLIRSTKDRGVVVVFDRRLTTTRYGGSFIKSLPTLHVSEKPIENLLQDLKSWL